MIILFNIDDLLFDLFPTAKGAANQREALKEALTNYYSYSVYKPDVQIEGQLVTVTIPTKTIAREKDQYDKVVTLASKGNYREAKPALDALIRQNPTNSEYYRIYGQILSEEGDQNEAINYLIDALRWDPKNGYALIMMGKSTPGTRRTWTRLCGTMIRLSASIPRTSLPLIISGQISCRKDVWRRA